MKLYVANITDGRNKDLKKLSKPSKEFDNKVYTVKEHYFNNEWFALRLYKSMNNTTRGVVDNNSVVAELPFVINKGADGLVEICFIFIDMRTDTIYYDCTESYLKSFVARVYNTENILFDLSINQLHSIKTLTIIEKENPNLSMFPANINTGDEFQRFDIEEVVSINPSEKATTFTFDSGLVRLNNLKKLLKRVGNDPDVELKAEGFDKNGNQLRLAKTLQKSIEIFTEKIDASRKSQLPLSDIISIIESK